MIRHIEVRVTPTMWARPGDVDLHTVEIDVRTATEHVSLREVIPDSEFVSRFQWMIKRIAREVIERCCEN